MLDVNGTGRFSGMLTIYNNQLTVTGGGYDGTFADSIFFGGNSEGTNYRNKISNSLSSNPANQKMKFSVASGATTWVDALTLTGTGNVGIGTSSPNYTFDVSKTVAADFVARIANTSSTGYGLYVQANDNTKAGIRIANASGATAIDLFGSGEATFTGSVTATSFFESSSIKGKDIIATNPLLALDIDVIKYTRKSDESKDIRYGYSAEQIHSLMPELTDKDITAVKYLDVHTILISQLQKEIKELKAKMN
jgi:hypothetical protein